MREQPPKAEHTAEEKINWLRLATKFSADGDLKGMRACAQEVDRLMEGDIDATAVNAEVALYSGRIDEAEELAEKVLHVQPRHPRARMVQAGLAALEFRLDDEIPLLADLIEELTHKAKVLGEEDLSYAIYHQMLKRARGWLADALYLAGEPKGAAHELLMSSRLADTSDEAAELYSKYLFMRNYRYLGAKDGRQKAEAYDEMQDVHPYVHEHTPRAPQKKLRIGYISPDFREHAVAYFLSPLLHHFDGERFMVFCYAAGRSDAVTERLRTRRVTWRDLRGRAPRKAARLIAEDKIDILVDLSGHSQDNALPIMAYRPAPVQVSGIGYTNTTGLHGIDYFLSDEVCIPKGDLQAEAGFTERILRLPHSHLCYAPEVIRVMPEAGYEPPMRRNGYVTFGSFNNFAKATDEILLLWRGILESVRGSKLIIKGKICSIDSGVSFAKKRLSILNFDLTRVEFRPYSPDYLEQYRDIDIALDTAPYNGGLTTCEALYMGVPVISLRGRTHGARFAASILTNAGVRELIAENDINYVRRAVQLAETPKLLEAYHMGLRANMKRSPLMNVQGYMDELETAYQEIWENFCASSSLT
jgi:TPR domain/SEC-C domain protein